MIFSCAVSDPNDPPTAFKSRFLAFSSMPNVCGTSSVTPCAPQTASAHLRKLSENNLIALVRQGRLAVYPSSHGQEAIASRVAASQVVAVP